MGNIINREDLMPKKDYSIKYRVNRTTLDKWIFNGPVAVERIENKDYINTEIPINYYALNYITPKRVIIRDDLMSKRNYCNTRWGLNRISLDKSIDEGLIDIERIGLIDFVKIKTNPVIKVDIKKINMDLKNKIQESKNS